MLSREYRTLLRGPENPRRARWLLAEGVSRAISEAGLETAAGVAADRVVRLAVPAERVNPFRWLRDQRVGPRLYWSGREDGFEVAAAGTADVQEGDDWEGADGLRKRLALLAGGDPRTRYYGGMRFDPARKAGEEWGAFGAYRFVLPRFELRAEDGVTVLVCNLVLPRDAEKHEEILDQIERLSFPRKAVEFILPRPVRRVDGPDLPGWRRNIERAFAAFAEGRMDKVVFARRAELGFEEELDAALLAESLKAATPGCFHFYFEPEEGTAFVGASPERLYRRDGRRVRSEAVAGTRPRGESEADDDGLRDDLLGSAKDREEQRYVRVGIKEQLGPLCEELEVEEGASEMKLASRRHLVSRIRGALREGIADPELLFALHPTPAVGGYPRRLALKEIREAEPFDRGWYAGPVGWIGPESAEFAVGIRSGLVRGRTLALFSGAGIVAGSLPEDEWAEVDQKIADFTRILELGQRHASR